jgi:hypothetical protein
MALAARPEKRTSEVPRGNGDLSGARPPVERIMRAKVAGLIHYAKNPRLHSAAQVDQIAASMREFGQAQLVVVDEKGEIIAGHGRILAAEKLGWTHVMVGVAVGWTETQKRAYRITDNQLALNSTWDTALLQAELQELRIENYELGLLGFESDSLVDLLVPTEPAAMSQLEASTKLADRFGAVPFSVFNAREGWWQDRKQAWLALGIRSELGRGENLLKFSDTILER